MTQENFASELQAVLKLHNVERLREEYWNNDEFLYISDFLPDLLVSALQQELPNLRQYTHRVRIPGVRKGGSVGATNVRTQTSLIRTIYASSAVMGLFSRIIDRDLSVCPPDDEHAMALYSYTEEGDFIHYHYDTSFYKGNRYTVLITLQNNSSCKLMYDLYRKSPGRTVQHQEVNTSTGSMVVFNGNKLWHAVSPAKDGEERHVLSLEYLDDQRIGLFGKLVSEVKDRIGYFGIRGKKNVAQTRLQS
ncbi:MAG TPA: 2OG-Fe(II) oxygenase [Bacteroidota bacterium]|nr:2OG-Fe(II) oxygenase [Bacteroidota bacterium]